MGLRKRQNRPARRNNWTQLEPWQRRLLIGVPSAIAVLTVVAVVLATQGVRDRATEWAVIGALFTAAAAVVAVLGLPFAIWQLWIVQKEQERIATQLEKAADIELGILPAAHEPLLDTLRLERPGPNESRALSVTVAARNHGGRSVENPHLEIEIAIPPGFVLNGTNGTLRREIDGRTARVERSLAVLNQGQQLEVNVVSSVDEKIPERLDLLCRFMSQDAEPLTKEVAILFGQVANIGQPDVKALKTEGAAGGS